MKLVRRDNWLWWNLRNVKPAKNKFEHRKLWYLFNPFSIYNPVQTNYEIIWDPLCLCWNKQNILINQPQNPLEHPQKTGTQRPRQARTKGSGKRAGECATTCAILTNPPGAARWISCLNQRWSPTLDVTKVWGHRHGYFDRWRPISCRFPNCIV